MKVSFILAVAMIAFGSGSLALAESKLGQSDSVKCTSKSDRSKPRVEAASSSQSASKKSSASQSAR